jgi:hypothetical protein
MRAKSFDEWWDATSDVDNKLDKQSAERIWQAAQRHYQDELQHTVLLYKTLFPLANGLRAYLEEHVSPSVFVMSNGQWVFKAFCEELDYIQKELGQNQ